MDVLITIAVGVTVLNALLTWGVIRRLREHTILIGDLSAGMSGVPSGVGLSPLRPGTDSIGPFSAMTTTGTPIVTFGPGTLVGFFSPTCAPCREQAPKFIRAAAEWSGDRVAVVVGDRAQAADLLPAWDAPLVIGADADEVALACGVDGYPAIMVIGPDGRIDNSSALVERIRPLIAV